MHKNRFRSWIRNKSSKHLKRFIVEIEQENIHLSVFHLLELAVMINLYNFVFVQLVLFRELLATINPYQYVRFLDCA